MCFFTCKRHLEHCYVKCVEYYSRKKEIAIHMPKKHKHILVPSHRYQDFRYLLQNPTVPNYVIGFSNSAQRFTGSNYLDVDSPLADSRLTYMKHHFQVEVQEKYFWTSFLNTRKYARIFFKYHRDVIYSVRQYILTNKCVFSSCKTFYIK